MRAGRVSASLQEPVCTEGGSHRIQEIGTSHKVRSRGCCSASWKLSGAPSDPRARSICPPALSRVSSSDSPSTLPLLPSPSVASVPNPPAGVSSAPFSRPGAALSLSLGSESFSCSRAGHSPAGASPRSFWRRPRLFHHPEPCQITVNNRLISSSCKSQRTRSGEKAASRIARPAIELNHSIPDKYSLCRAHTRREPAALSRQGCSLRRSRGKTTGWRQGGRKSGTGAGS
jgi:hypothetical protein